MTYEEILARQPKSTSAGDRVAAKHYVEFLSAQITAGLDAFNDSQRQYIYKQRRIWQARADGQDERWNTYGSRPGRPAKPKRNRSHYKREEDSDPLLASLLRKFGTPRPREEDV